MACVLKATVVALAIIAAENQFSGAAGSKVYDIKKFLTKNPALLIIRKTHGTFNRCKWYQRQDMSDTDVMVSAWVYIDNTKRKATGGDAKIWTFKGEDKMWNGDETSEDDRDEKWLLYKTDNDSCGVLQYDEIYDSLEIERRTYYELLVNQDNMHNLPPDCLKAYLEKIGTTAENKNSDEDLKTCKFE
ncbi:uncharacterized protein LOC142764803 [Rhipicephalus microplus]|uniref:uncharacterized protein LOC142764803 n=1 Tax=Rhipicephalus microplus TaxID=6941 RepID=UPI003F6D2D78